MKFDWTDDNTCLLGDINYGYYFCKIHFYDEPILRNELSRDDWQDVVDSLRDTLINALADNEGELDKK